MTYVDIVRSDTQGQFAVGNISCGYPPHWLDSGQLTRSNLSPTQTLTLAGVTLVKGSGVRYIAESGSRVGVRVCDGGSRDEGGREVFVCGGWEVGG